MNNYHKKEFKKNKIGWVPSGWEVKRLGEIAFIDKNNLDSNISPDYEFYYISLSDVEKGKLANELQKIKFLFAPSRARRKVSNNDILLATVRPNLQSFYYVRENKLDLVASTGFSVITCKIGYSSEFIYHYLYGRAISSQIYSLVVGSNYPAINSNDVKKLKIAVPPLPEQKKIAEILSTWDDAIEKTRALIAAKEKLKKALMQQLLTGEKRFREFEGEEWKIKRIKEIRRVVAGGTPDTKNPKYWNGNIYWCIPTDITALNGKYITQTARKITKEGLKNSSAEILPPKSVIVCTRATIGECAINMVPMATNQGFKSIVPDRKVESEYLYYWIKLNKNVLLRLGAGSTFFEVPKKDFEKIKIIIPNRAEQKNIVAVLSTFDQEIELFNKKLAALQRQKKGLMQVLLTGKVRVKVDA